MGTARGGGRTQRLELAGESMSKTIRIIRVIRGDPLAVLAPVVIAESSRRQCIAGSLLRRSSGPGEAPWVLCLVVREAGRAFDERHFPKRTAGDGQVMIARLDGGGGPDTFRAFTVSRNEGVAYLS